MTQAAELAGYASSLPQFRNRIINGDMRIDQRNAGASVGPFAIASAGYKGVDRWFIATDTMTSQRITGNAPTGFSNYLKLTKTSTSNIDIRQTIELDSAGQAGEFSTGKTFTLSFYAKSASGGETLDFFAYFRQSVATGTATSLTAPSGVTLSTSWVRYEVLFTIDVSPSASDLCIAFGMHTAATELHLTGVQLEEGTVATPFEHRPIGVELSLCQRYYERGVFAFETPSVGNHVTTLSFNTAKRAAAAVTFTNVVTPNGTASILASNISQFLPKLVANGGTYWFMNWETTGAEL